MQSSERRTFSLIDTGLTEPRGLAFDHERGFLYIADSGAEKIFRYTVIIEPDDQARAHSGGRKLSITHVQLIMAQDCGPVEWVTVDDAGNLFYSAPRTNNINKISTEVMSKLSTGEVQASALVIVPEKSLEGNEAASNLMALSSAGDTLPTNAPPVEPKILSIYEAKL